MNFSVENSCNLHERSIKELSKIISEVVGYNGSLIFDTNKPDGTPRKLMDVSKLHHLGWKHSISLTEGVKKIYDEGKDMAFAN